MRAIEKKLLQLEQQFWKALQNRDVATATGLTSFPCIVTGPQGVGNIDEPAFATMMKDARYKIDDFEISDVQIRVVRDDVAVVAYKVHEELTVDGKPVIRDAADSSTWVRFDGRWTCAAHTETIVQDPFGRDQHVREAHDGRVARLRRAAARAHLS